MSANGSGLLVIERILRDRQSIWQQIVAERELGRLTGNMLASSAIALALYGAVLGAFHSVLMAVTSAVKLPLLFLVTLAICLPTLYLFNLVFGARLSVRQALAMVMVAVTVTSMLAVAFAPISLFFLITAPDYGFFKLLNVAILTLSAIVGLRFLTGGMQVLNAHGLLAPAAAVPAGAALPAGAAGAAVPAGAGAAADAGVTAGVGVELGAPAEPALVGAATTGVNGDSASTVATPAAPAVAPPQMVVPVPALVPPPVWDPHFARPLTTAGGYPMARPMPGRPGSPAGQRPASMTLLYIWILLFGFVGTQLAWTLRPFFGSPGQDFALFRSIEGNFYAEILRTIANLF